MNTGSAEGLQLLRRNLFAGEIVWRGMKSGNEVKKQKVLIEAVAQLAMQLSQPHLADYGATTSRHDFTQRQLMSCLILRVYLKTTYRGLLEVLAGNGALRACLGLEEKLPHYTTLQKFSARPKVQAMIGRIGTAAMQGGGDQEPAAMDSTGLATTGASAYFTSRRGNRCRSYIKLSAIVLCGSLLPLALALDQGPSNDWVQVPQLLEQAQRTGRPRQLLADAGYDAEWIHQRCREQWGVESLIKPVNQRADGTRSGQWRALMSPQYMDQRGYRRRWGIETFISALKRTVGSALSTRTPATQLTEAAIRVLTYALRR